MLPYNQIFEEKEEELLLEIFGNDRQKSIAMLLITANILISQAGSLGSFPEENVLSSALNSSLKQLGVDEKDHTHNMKTLKGDIKQFLHTIHLKLGGRRKEEE